VGLRMHVRVHTCVLDGDAHVLVSERVVLRVDQRRHRDTYACGSAQFGNKLT